MLGVGVGVGVGVESVDSATSNPDGRTAQKSLFRRDQRARYDIHNSYHQYGPSEYDIEAESWKNDGCIGPGSRIFVSDHRLISLY